MSWPTFWVAAVLLLIGWLGIEASSTRWPPRVVDIGVALVSIIVIAAAFAVVSSGGLVR